MTTNAFDCYRETRSRESLVALLESCQHRVYNVCFQVLRQREDAEDASQNVLLEILNGIHEIPDSRHFDRWLYRISLHTAIDWKRKRNRRRGLEEGKALMNVPTDLTPLPADTLRDAVHDAIAKLGDDERALILDHYFEKISLDELGSKAGCSAVAVWKRISKAKERLRLSLSQAGLGAFLPGLDPFLESIAPTSGSVTLLTPAILAKVETVAAATGVSLLTTTGGLLMAKTLLSPLGILAGMILLGLGVGTGMLLESKREDASPSHIRELEDRLKAVSAELETARRDADRGKRGAESVKAENPSTSEKSVEGKTSTPSAPPSSVSISDVLLARIARHREWLKDSWRRADEIKRKEGETAFQDFMNNLDLESERELAGMRELILAAPDTFVRFLQEDNGDCMRDLLRTLEKRERTGPREYTVWPLSVNELPSSLVEGIVELLRSPSFHNKSTLLVFLRNVKDPSDNLRIAYFHLLDADDAHTVRAAVDALVGYSNTKIPADHLSRLQQIAENSSDKYLTQSCLRAIAFVDSPEAKEYLLRKLETASDPDVISASAQALHWQANTSPEPERYSKALVMAANQTTNPVALKSILYTALQLSIPNAVPVLEMIRARSSSSELNDLVGRLLERIQGGETSNDVLRQLLYDWDAPRKVPR